METMLIWDFDGTLAWREGMWAGAMEEAVRARFPDHSGGSEDIRPHLQSGFPWHDWRVPRSGPASAVTWWRSLDPVFCNALIRAGVDPAEVDALLPSIQTRYLAPESWSLFEDVRPFFASETARSHRHVVLSNHVPELEDLMVHLGIRELFEAVFNSARTGIEKPHPEAFRQVQRSFPEVTRFVMIGDSYRADFAGAASVGIDAILVRRADERSPVYCESLAGLHRLIGPDTLASTRVTSGAGPFGRDDSDPDP